ncbi:MAG: M20/M25/M40 family metallo-hydrolase [Thermoplasmata archaeon]|nr:M20/M25/M40 family metallo-hydrolase [Thermoplasmata archaeon]
MAASEERTGLAQAAQLVGDREGLDLLANLVSIAPTNLEDPLHGRYEKPNYGRAVDRIVRAAQHFGLATRIYDPVVHGPPAPHLGTVPRPNVIVDLDVGATDRTLILAHYDVVPVPTEQLARWKSPPHTLTQRADGRLYGRGANDDLGSGVVPALVAMRRLASEGDSIRNVRLLVCCDEETGGEGGVESLKKHDDALPTGDPGRFLLGEVALIPDGSPHATSGSSGVAFLDASFDRPVPLSDVLDFGEELISLHDVAKRWKSRYASPDWPEHLAPEPVLTGRATLTKFDVVGDGRSTNEVALRAAHAETDAANQIAESVTLVFEGPPTQLGHLLDRLRPLVEPPFHVEKASASSLVVPPEALAVQVIGRSAHGGYPHRGANPVPASLRLLRKAIAEGWLDVATPVEGSFAVDLRLLPEMTLESGRDEVLAIARRWIVTHEVGARLEAPESRCRRGYALSPDHPAVRRLERILRAEGGEAGTFGEYGGTDASSLAEVRTPSGDPIPAIVFGSMDREAHIHEAEESIDPAMMGAMVRTIYRFLREP